MEARIFRPALLYDVTMGGALAEKLYSRKQSYHKRVWTMQQEGYVQGERLRDFRATRCEAATEEADAVRREYAVDPWGTSYWVFTERLSDSERRVVVYSFGPNRRRDGKVSASAGGVMGDDVVATTVYLKN